MFRSIHGRETMRLVFIKHPFKGREFDDPQIEEWLQEKYQQGLRICAMPVFGKWIFEQMDTDDGK